MPNINITVAEKIATNMSPGVNIVCGNSDYSITFTFDSEWTGMENRTARFLFYKQGRSWFTDTPFTGNTANVPVLAGVDFVLVGVYAGELHTTTPARIYCNRSILCDEATEQPAGPTRESLEDLIAEIEQKLASGAFNGPPGPAGPTGPAGADGTVAFSDLTEAQRESLRGPAGPQGADGVPGVWVGSEAPPDDSYTVWVDPAGRGVDVFPDSGGSLDAYIEGETLVFTSSSTATIENETLIL
jgi:hypothetical protein